ncbi:Protein FAM210B, mitochondrial [Galemys pyrenaicus]|uniref:Protein FAM210B, mitochondrial n=1 Tax=Galemys pyrenaicus TaxID=202257 RepID=A0A8J6AIR7_GALPY|nr:Protein FAM210B, mitochondrial [Galemys pyrenaicus]
MGLNGRRHEDTRTVRTDRQDRQDQREKQQLRGCTHLRMPTLECSQHRRSGTRPQHLERSMAGLLTLLGSAGRVGARIRPCATWLLVAASPPPRLLPLLRPVPDARLLRTTRGDCHGRQDPSKGMTATGSSASSTEQQPSKTQQLRKVFQEYGAVGVSFHIGVSLMSLGIFYMVVSSGVDMSAILLKLGFKESLVQSKVAAGTSTFVVAYAIHKLFAPVRISITLVSAPLIVRYFRKVGFFKPPAAKP